MTTTVYFDLDGTLCSYDDSFEALFSRSVSPYGNPTDAAYDAYVDRLLTALDRCESDPYRRAFEDVTETVELDATPATLADEYRDVELEATVVTADAKRVLESVSATNPTGVVTNGDGSQQQAKLERHDIDELVDEVLVSNSVGLRKPDRALFELATERLPADEFIYVGDSYDEDIVGAHEAGFRTVFVCDRLQEQEQEQEQEREYGSAESADAVVSSVGELLDLDSLPASIREPFTPRA